MNKIRKAGLLILSLMVSAVALVGCGEDLIPDDSSATGSSIPNSSTVETSSEATSSVEASSEATSSVEESSEEASSEESSSVHEHSYTIAMKNETHHWNECDCGEKQDEEAHVAGAEVKYDETNHWNECECGYKMNVTVHTLEGGKDEDYHWGQCDCGYTATQEAHRYTLAKSDATHHWNECVCGAIDEKVEHDYATAKFDEEAHWNECACGAKSGETAHDYTAEKKDDTQHWIECACGAKSGVEAHDFGDLWSHDEDKHWKDCDCGAKVEEEHATALQSGVVEGFYQASYACCGRGISFEETTVYFDRLNKYILEVNGNVKENENNYWDGTTSIVEVAMQGDESVKLSFDPSKFTPEEKALAGSSLWVAYAIPVGALDLNYSRISFKYKAENMNANLIAYGAKNAEDGVDYVYETGDYLTVKGSEQVDLGEGWYQYTFIIRGTTAGTTEADYIVLSLDNCGTDNDKEVVSTAYIKDVKIEKVSYCTITVDGVAKEVVVGDTVVLEDPEESGYKFLGWKDADGNDVANGFTATEDITLVSQWEKLPISLKLGTNAVDISESVANNEFYVKYSFTAKAGTYSVSVTGGIKAFELADGEVTETALTQFVFTEETTSVFVITYGDDLELQGNVKIEYIYNPEISEDATKISDSAFRTDSNFKGIVANTDDLGDVSVPNGFTTISRFDSTAEDTATTNPWTSGSLNANAINKTELSAYEEVWFAITLQNAFFNISGLGAYTPNGWVYFHLTKVGAELWKIEISINGETTTQNNQSGTAIDANTPTNAISTIFTGGGFAAADSGYVLIYHVGQGTASLWSTEIVGVKSEYNPNIPTTAEEATTSVIGNWSGFDYTDPVTDTNGVTAPKGFSTVTRYDSKASWTSGVLDANCYDKTDLSAYSEVWFAVKVVNGVMQVGVNGVGEKTTKATTLEDAKWIYFHLTQTATNVWTIEITIDGVAYKTLTNQSGAEHADAVAKLPTNGLSTILFGSGNKETDQGWVLFTREADGTTVNFYCTEVLGVKSAS